MKQLLKAVLTPAGGLALIGLSGWITADAVNEALVYRHCQRIGLQRAADNVELGEQLGLPLRPGPWYNASIGLTHGNHMANCQFTVIGSKHSSDIYMRVNSSCFWHSSQAQALYNCPAQVIRPVCLAVLTDGGVPAQVVRTKGPRSTLLYNIVGPAKWDVLMMEASVSAGGGLSRNISLTEIPRAVETDSMS
ncbi:TPA: hypothetical protein ACH3X2_013812 [Trebouxia sp. C0005]